MLNVSSQLSSPFFCGEGPAGRVKCLAGDEIDGWKNSKLPPLRMDSAPEGLDWNKVSDTGDGQVSSLRQYESLERWEAQSGFRSEAALLLQRLWVSFVSSVRLFSFPFLLFSGSYESLEILF
jgi:hypothetical protein